MSDRARPAAALQVGTSVRVRVPATTANLGPAFDSAGMCLTLCDDIEVDVAASGCSVEVTGEGEGTLPADEGHLVVRAVRAGLGRAGLDQPGIVLRAHNRIPHGRGLGSSAAATVGGLLAARELAAAAGHAHLLDRAEILSIATAFEGHADNVAAALMGGLTLVWSAGPGRVDAVRVPVHDEVVPLVLVPEETLSTAQARGLLPESVPHQVAAQNAARAALLVVALTSRPDLLLAATADRLHQPYRAAAFPGSMAIVERLRALGHAAVISGAGPSVLVLARTDTVAGVGAPAGWRMLRLEVDLTGARAQRRC